MAHMSAAQIIALRFTFAGIMLASMCDWRYLPGIAKRNRKHFLVVSLFGITVSGIAYVQSLQYLPIAVATFIADAYPALAIVLATIFLGEKPGPRHVIGMASALLGLYLLTNPGAALSGAAMQGILLALVACLCWAFSGVSSKILCKSVSPRELSSARYLLGGLFALPAVFLSPEGFSLATPEAWALIIVLSAVSAVAISLYYYALSRINLSTSSIIESSTPVITLVLGVLLFGQALTKTQLVGAGLVAFGTISATVRLENHWKGIPRLFQ